MSLLQYKTCHVALKLWRATISLINFSGNFFLCLWLSLKHNRWAMNIYGLHGIYVWDEHKALARHTLKADYLQNHFSVTTRVTVRKFCTSGALTRLIIWLEVAHQFFLCMSGSSFEFFPFLNGLCSFWVWLYKQVPVWEHWDAAEAGSGRLSWNCDCILCDHLNLCITFFLPFRFVISNFW